MGNLLDPNEPIRRTFEKPVASAPIAKHCERLDKTSASFGRRSWCGDTNLLGHVHGGYSAQRLRALLQGGGVGARAGDNGYRKTHFMKHCLCTEYGSRVRSGKNDLQI